jgi:hypothetical protein
METCAKPELEIVRERIKAWRESREKRVLPVRVCKGMLTW